MNWEVAKNWLLAAFLLLDLFLGWQVYESRREMLGYVASASDRLANTKTILSEHGFILDTNVPLEHPNMAFVRAEFGSVPLADLGQAAFPQSNSLQVDEQAGVVRGNQGEIRTLGQGQWQVHYATPVPISDPGLSNLPGVWQAGQYQPDAGHTPASAAGKTGGSANGVRVFVQTAAGFPVFDAQVQVDVAAGRATGFTQTWLTGISPVGDAKPTISAMDALDSLASAVDKSTSGTDNKILSVTLGYVHKVPKSPAGAQEMPAPNYWFPVWRVVTIHHTYYINAFTGEVAAES
jgi:hypothetical protein